MNPHTKILATHRKTYRHCIQADSTIDVWRTLALQALLPIQSPLFGWGPILVQLVVRPNGINFPNNGPIDGIEFQLRLKPLSTCPPGAIAAAETFKVYVFWPTQCTTGYAADTDTVCGRHGYKHVWASLRSFNVWMTSCKVHSSQ